MTDPNYTPEQPNPNPADQQDTERVQQVRDNEQAGARDSDYTGPQNAQTSDDVTGEPA